MKRKGIFEAFPILIIFTVVGVILGLLNWYFQNKETVIISHDSGIYTESFQLTVNTLQSAEVYYTLDGSVPEPSGKNTYLYDAPIDINIKDTTDTYVIQIKCMFANGKISPIFCREYIMEKAGTDRFSTEYIVSITGDEDALFGYDNGIFVRGRQYDEFMTANPDVDIANTVIPANYFSDEEIPVHVSFFSKYGETIVSKNCGLKIYGNVTRAKNQKSFRLYARESYDGINKFEYPFISGLISEKNNHVVDEYQRISFHNSGNDNGYGFVRTELIGKLAAQTGFQDVLQSESAVVYVNGKYQGLYWLQNTYDDKYFKEKYGNYTGEMVVCEGWLDSMSSSNFDDLDNNQCVEEYNKFCQWVAEVDLNLDENWEIVNNTIDISNFAKYMAIEYYINNKDWPTNNVKVYRYVTDEEYEADSVFDGKYRYLLYDTDYGLGLMFWDWFGLDANSKRLEELCRKSNLFSSLMQREEFRNSFVNIVLVMSQEMFGADNVGEVLSDLCLQKDRELRYAYEQTDLYKDSLWESDDRSFEDVVQNNDAIMEYAEVRPSVVYDEMQTVLETGNLLRLYMNMEVAGNFSVNGIKVKSLYEGYCYEKVPVTITCSLPVGMYVKGYDVNGRYVEGDTLTLIPSEYAGMGNVLNVTPILEERREEQLHILTYDIDGREDYVVLENSGNIALNLSDYAISDSMNTSKGRLPELILEPGEIFFVYGKHYMGHMTDKSIMVSFSWNDEENIVLSNIHKGIIDRR